MRILDDDFEDNYKLVDEEYKVLKAVNDLVTNFDPMIRLLQVILIIISLCILYLWQVA